jgi:hypothetical protein
VNPLKIKISSKNMREKPTNTSIIQSVYSSQISSGKVVSPKHLLPLPPGNIPGTHFC